MNKDSETAPARETRGERRADNAVQIVNVVLALVGCTVLGVRGYRGTDAARLAALAAYGAGLLAMVTCSAIYGWGRYHRRRLHFRALDQAAIFVMIAGTYTPFIVVCAPDGHEPVLLVAIWATALAGILLRLAAPRRFEPFVVVFYLLMGWAAIVDPGLLLRLPSRALVLMAAGGALYTAGVAFHLSRMRYQETIWHCFVASAAACQFAAIFITAFLP